VHAQGDLLIPHPLDARHHVTASRSNSPNASRIGVRLTFDRLAT